MGQFLTRQKLTDVVRHAEGTGSCDHSSHIIQQDCQPLHTVLDVTGPTALQSPQWMHSKNEVTMLCTVLGLNLSSITH